MNEVPVVGHPAERGRGPPVFPLVVATPVRLHDSAFDKLMPAPASTAMSDYYETYYRWEKSDTHSCIIM